MASIALRSCLTLIAFSALTACGGGGANSDAKEPDQAKNTHEFRADVINLIPVPASAQLNSKIDLFYRHVGMDEVEIAENVDYLERRSSSSFGWEGLPKANLSFSLKDALNNQALLSTTNMRFAAAQEAFFLLATGQVSASPQVSLQRVDKLSGEQQSYRFTHANALDARSVDIYNADTQTALVLNLNFNQTSGPLKYDPNLAQSTIIVLAAGTTPNYTDTSQYLLQTRLSHHSHDHLNLLVANPGSPSSWQVKEYAE